MKRWIAALALLASCAHEAEPTSGSDDDAQMGHLQAELSGYAQQLSAAGEPAPCRQSCVLAQNICDVSEKMCAIAARHADRPDMTSRCKDARATCQQSKEECGRRCPPGSPQ